MFPYPGPGRSRPGGRARRCTRWGTGSTRVLEAVFILAQLAVILAFLVIVTYSKHLHIFLAPLNVMFSRRPDGLGPLQPMRVSGKVLDFEEADPDTDVLGLGKIEDFSWKGLLDMGTCTECGRCQSQCPAWATGKPCRPSSSSWTCATTPSPRPPTCWPPRTSARACRRRARRGGPAAGRRPRRQRGHRPRGAVGLHQLRRLRQRVPGRHRAHRPHQRHAPPPGPRRVRLPRRSAGDAQQPGAQGQPVGHARGPPRRLDRRDGLRGPRRGRGHPAGRRVPVLGRLRRRPGGPGQEGHQGHRGAAARRRGEVRRPRPGRGLHRRPRPRLGNEFVFQMLAAQNIEALNEPGWRPGQGRRSSRPARTASTPSPASTPSSAATTRSSTTPSSWPGWWKTGS